jgi:hypothetical protein
MVRNTFQKKGSVWATSFENIVCFVWWYVIHFLRFTTQLTFFFGNRWYVIHSKKGFYYTFNIFWE